jgi:hypothetical protein
VSTRASLHVKRAFALTAALVLGGSTTALIGLFAAFVVGALATIAAPLAYGAGIAIGLLGVMRGWTVGTDVYAWLYSDNVRKALNSIDGKRTMAIGGAETSVALPTSRTEL